MYFARHCGRWCHGLQTMVNLQSEAKRWLSTQAGSDNWPTTPSQGTMSFTHCFYHHHHSSTRRSQWKSQHNRRASSLSGKGTTFKDDKRVGAWMALKPLASHCCPGCRPRCHSPCCPCCCSWFRSHPWSLSSSPVKYCKCAFPLILLSRSKGLLSGNIPTLVI